MSKAKWVPATPEERRGLYCYEQSRQGHFCDEMVVEVCDGKGRCVKHGGTDHDAKAPKRPSNPARWTLDTYPSGLPRRICQGYQVVVLACGDSPVEWRAVRALVSAANRGER